MRGGRQRLRSVPLGLLRREAAAILRCLSHLPSAVGWWWSKKQGESDDLREMKRHLAMVYGQSRAALTLTAAVLESMSPFQRAGISMVLKKYIVESISMRDLPEGIGAPERAGRGNLDRTISGVSA